MSKSLSWDYTLLAETYDLRPTYSNDVVEALLAIAGLKAGSEACDVGAGTGHLSIHLARRSLMVSAIEPNEAMRLRGIANTESLSSIRWFDGMAEDTKQQEGQFQLVTFGSSFNVCNQADALIETSRILQPQGYFCCLWNHRVLTDPIQAQIENIITQRVPSYTYGKRREDPSDVIQSSGLFTNIVHISSAYISMQSVESCVLAWRSHATLQRQAGDNFNQTIHDIEHFLKSLHVKELRVPYQTVAWIARDARKLP
jgi:ubiquinone/menaquinone biosynthesis C-methylase UbiE